MSTFRKINNLITVNDICEPFIGIFDNFQNADDLWEKWTIDLCSEKGLDPMAQIALVKNNQKKIGWIGFDMLESSKTLSENMEPITSNIIISSNTPLLEAIHIVINGNDLIYLILRGNDFVGYLTYNHFNKLPFRMSLFSLVIDLESSMLKMIKSQPKSFFNKLNRRRIKKAENRYKYFFSSNKKDDVKYTSKLIDCTTLIDKFTMLKRTKNIVQKCPNIKNRSQIDMVDKLRNSIAHPKEETSSLPINKEELIPFIQWVEELQKQLNSYQKNIVQ